MPVTRELRRGCKIALMLLACVAPGAGHAAYPERPISLIVPFPAGGPTDIIARIVSVAFHKGTSNNIHLRRFVLG